MAQNKASASEVTARQLGNASIILSIIGILFGVVCWFFIVA